MTAARNFAPLGVLSFGEAWHNFHHAHPRSARHGALPHQIDPSAAVIRVLRTRGLGNERPLADAEATRSLPRLKIGHDGDT